MRVRVEHLAFLLAMAPLPAQAPEPPIDFGRDVRPILADNCFRCHGPDAQQRKAGLRLDVRDSVYGALESGHTAVVPGDVSASELVRRVLSEDPDVHMPPPDSGRALDERQRAVLVRWVEQGAPWQAHWAFRRMQRPELPAVADANWPRQELDRFVLAALERDGRKPSPPADRHTFVRRVTLDLTGLPPAPDEVRAFVGDAAPGAEERLVDRLLASPRHGEHLARHWLDVARYGDTHGLHLDNYREMWPYRDRVIAAFHADQPFDRFVIEQLAGDLLPDATLEQRIASGFLRCHVSTNEGGSIEEEVYVRNVTDCVDTTGTALLGLTLGCAACHDHKFDPIPQRDYYRMFAFLNSLDGSPMDGNDKAPGPVVRVPSAEQEARSDELRAQRDAIEAEIAAALAAIEYVEPPPDEASEAPRVATVWVDDALPPGAVAKGGPFEWVAEPVHSGQRAMRRSGPDLHQHFFEVADTKLRIGEGDVLFAWVHVAPGEAPRQLMLQFNGDGADDWGHRAYWGESVIPWGDEGSASRRRAGDLPAEGEWVKLEVAASDVGLMPGAVVHGIAFTQFGGTAVWDHAGIESRVVQAAEDFVWVDDAPPTGAVLQGDGAVWQWVEGDAAPVHSGRRSLRRGSAGGLSQDFFTGANPPLVVQRGDLLFAHAWLDADDPPRAVQLQFHSQSWNHRVRWGAEAHGAGAGGGADHRAGELPATGRWVRLEVPIADVGLASGAAIDGFAFTQVGGTVHWDAAGVRTWAGTDLRHLYSQKAWERIARSGGGVPDAVRDAARRPAAERSPDDQARLRDHFLRHVYAGSRAMFAPLEARLGAAREALAQHEAAIPTTLVMKERAEPRPAYVLERGEYTRRGEQVERGTPAVLPPMREDLPRDRLGLAQWIVDPEHPLTARVWVNRMWQRMFGVGIVKTSEDFGHQGEPPSHPELLDWLATEFVADGWSTRRLLRRIALSATYRQSSRATAEEWARDRDNRSLARGPRHRLDAETLRDQALFVSGLLVERIGGPGVKPPQPAGLWEAVAYVGSNTMKFVADEGAERVYRRSLYTFWKRTAPPPQMTTFDAPSRESCTVRRERTNTPLQALLLLNEQQYVEAARALGARILREGGPHDRARAGFALFLVTARPPEAAEVGELVDFVRAQREAFAAEPERARALTGADEATAGDPAGHAAWTLAANLLLNLDEVLTKG